MCDDNNSSEFHNSMLQRFSEDISKINEIVAQTLKLRAKDGFSNLHLSKCFYPENSELPLEFQKCVDEIDQRSYFFEEIQKRCEVPPLTPNSPNEEDIQKLCVVPPVASNLPNEDGDTTKSLAYNFDNAEDITENSFTDDRINTTKSLEDEIRVINNCMSSVPRNARGGHPSQRKNAMSVFKILLNFLSEEGEQFQNNLKTLMMSFPEVRAPLLAGILYHPNQN